eukprot:2162897-Prymnesium_polylepis.1
MGPRVLAASLDGSAPPEAASRPEGASLLQKSLLRVYAHCARGGGVAVAFANADSAPREVMLRLQPSNEPAGGGAQRAEWHITAAAGTPTVYTRDVELNGRPLAVGADGALPAMPPAEVAAEEPLRLAPLSVGF